MDSLQAEAAPGREPCLASEVLSSTRAAALAPGRNANCAAGTADGVLSDRAWNAVGRSLNLSARELQIIRRIFADKNEAAIAEELRISPHTVRTHSERLYHKLQVHSRVELVVRAVDEFLRLTVQPDNRLPPICADLATGRCPLGN